MSKDGSAFFGEPPLTKHDANIMIGLFGSTKPPKKVPITEPGSKGPQLLTGLCFAIAFSFLITTGRLLTRALRKGQRFGADDWVIIPAVLVTIAYFCNILSRVPYACAGKHLNYCTYKEIGLFFELGGIGQVMFFAASTLIKISMTLFNRRLTGMTSHRWQIVHYSFLTLLFVWFFVTLFINIFQCTPVTAFFNFSLQVDTPSYHCLDTNKINYAFTIVNAVTDFCLLCVPIIIVASVRMPFWRRARLVVIFLLGSICCIASTCRIVFIHRSSRDFTYKFPQNVSLAIVDLFFGTVVASLPALNAFVEVLFQKTKTKISGYYVSATGRIPGSGDGAGNTSGASDSGSRPIGKGFADFVRASSRSGNRADGVLGSNVSKSHGGADGEEEDTFALPAHATAYGHSDLEHGLGFLPPLTVNVPGAGGAHNDDDAIVHGVPTLRSASSGTASSAAGGDSPTTKAKLGGGSCLHKGGPFVTTGEAESFFDDNDNDDNGDEGRRGENDGGGNSDGFEMKNPL